MTFLGAESRISNERADSGKGNIVRVGLHILCEKVNMRDERELRILCDATHEGFALPSFPATSIRHGSRFVFF